MWDLLIVVFYQPVFNLLIFLYNHVPGHDLGVAIILLTIIVKLIFLPLSKKSIQSQKSLQDLQPKIEEIKKQYGNDKEKMGRAMMDLYKEHQVNPFSSCLPLLIQLPFFIAIVEIFRDGLGQKSLDLVYPFLKQPETINTMAFGFLNLSQPNIILAVLTGIAQFFQTKMMMGKKPEVQSPGAQDENMMASMNKQMTYFMPLIIVFIGATLPAAFTLYLLVFNLTMLLQQAYILRGGNKNNDNKDNSDGDEESKESDKKVVEGEVVE